MISTEAPEINPYFSNKTIKEYRQHRARVHSVKWSNDGTKVASGSVDKTCKIFTLNKDNGDIQKIVELKGHLSSVDQICWNNESNQLATASSDKSIKLWDTRVGGGCVYSLDTPGENINISWKDSEIVYGNKNDLVTVVDVRNCSATSTGDAKVVYQKKYNEEINEMGWDDDGRLYLTCGSGCVKVLDGKSFEEIHLIEAHTSNIYCMDICKDYLAVGSADSLASIWDIRDYTACFNNIDLMKWPIRTLSFNYNNTMLALGSEDRAVEIVNINDGSKSLYTVKCADAVDCVCWNPNCDLLAYSTEEKDSKGDLGNFYIFGYSINN